MKKSIKRYIPVHRGNPVPEVMKIRGNGYWVKYEDTLDAWIEEEDKKSPGFKKDIENSILKWNNSKKEKNAKNTQKSPIFSTSFMLL